MKSEPPIPNRAPDNWSCRGGLMTSYGQLSKVQIWEKWAQTLGALHFQRAVRGLNRQWLWDPRPSIWNAATRPRGNDDNNNNNNNNNNHTSTLTLIIIIARIIIILSSNSHASSNTRVAYTILYYTISYYIILYYTILYHTILYYTILYYTIL